MTTPLMASPSPSLPDTPMSTLSTTAIKDGHSGHAHHARVDDSERNQRLEYFDMLRMQEEKDSAGAAADPKETERREEMGRIRGEVQKARAVNGVTKDAGDTSAMELDGKAPVDGKR